MKTDGTKRTAYKKGHRYQIPVYVTGELYDLIVAEAAEKEMSQSFVCAQRIRDTYKQEQLARAS